VTRTRQAGFQQTEQAIEAQGATHLKVFLLGGFRVLIGERRLEAHDFRLHKSRSLIKLLALEPGQRLHREQVIEALWPEADPAAARNNLHQVLHIARQALNGANQPCPYLIFEDEMLSLAGDTTAWVDAAAFERLARQALWTGTPESYELALAHYGGELLPEDRYEAWTENHRQRLREDYLELNLKLAKLLEAQRDFPQAEAVYQRLQQEDPLHEEVAVGRMRCLAEQGLHQQAAQTYQALAHALQQELGVEPAPATRQAYEHLLQVEVEEKPKPDVWVLPKRARHNLPRRLSSFVGRINELAQVKEMLAQQRLLTLVGAGGVGKSRLGLEAAWEVVEDYPDGIWMSELAAITDGKLLPQTLEAALGVQFPPGQPTEQALENYLQDKLLLLVLDNCEHILEACARLVGRLLEKCPDLRVLATSRAPLGLRGECVWMVPPLSMPDPEHLPGLEALRQYDALRLFAERAALAHPGFTVTAENGVQVAQVCRQLDGIPLAIELAAARAGLLGIEQISQRLGYGLDLLRLNRSDALPRHQTMRLCLDWSHAMLSAEEQTLLRRLAVFSGGFTLAAAETTCGYGEPEGHMILDALEALVNRSLVVVEYHPGDETRFRLLEPVRQYAAEKLAQAGETETLKDRHLAYYLDYAIEGEQYLRGPEQVTWQRRLMQEIHNFRAALSWALEREVYSGLHLALVLGRIWFINNMLVEGSRWIKLLIAKEESMTLAKERSPDHLWLHLCGLFATSRSESAIELLSGKLEAQVTPRLYNSLRLDWVYWKNIQNYDNSEELLLYKNGGATYSNAVFDRLRSLAPTLGAQGKRILVVHLNNMIAEPLSIPIKYLEDVEKNYAQVMKLFDLMLEISQQAGTVYDLSEAWGTGIGMFDTGDNRFENAVRDYQIALQLKEQAGDLQGAAYIKDRLAAALAGLGDFTLASQYLDEAITMFSKMGGYLLWKMALITKGTVTWCLGDEAGAEKMYRLAQNYSRDKDFDHHLAGYYLGCLAYLHGNYVQAEEYLRGLEQYCRQFVGKTEWADRNLAMTQFELGEMALHQDEVARAMNYLVDALAHHLKSPYARLHAVLHFALGKAASRQGQVTAARQHYAEALPHWGAHLGNPGLVYTLQALAELETAGGRYETAARLLGCAHALQPRLSNPYFFLYIIRLSLEPVDAAAIEMTTRQALGEAAFATAWAEGQRLDVEQAYALAKEICKGKP
jgi:predicted ATPase/DNA-binding SARP family transcriptional activator